MGEVVSRFDVHVEQVREFEFLVRFDKEQYAPLRMDCLLYTSPSPRD